jgi:hypothetical protein
MPSWSGFRTDLTLILVALTLSGALTAAADDAQRPLNEPPKGFTALFNGKDLAGWWGLATEDPRAWQSLPPDELARKRKDSLEDIRQHWRVQDGVLVNDGQGLYLTTDENYGDFELRLEYRTVAKADSGVYLRGIPQVQIWDYTREGGKWDRGADKGSGGLWNNSAGAPGKEPLVLADRPFGEWNKLRLIMVGERVTVYLNDKLVVDHARLENYFDHKLPLPRRGPIQLQTHGGEIRWRNIFLRAIPPEEANEILARHNSQGFESVFNGRDFTGWAGPVENYVVEDGAIMCRSGKGGTIYTEQEYGDFVVRLEIKLPPGGNNGLAIRYPGQGDTAYVGMCELQVLDSTHPHWAGLDPRQHHGSVYGQVPAHRGYLRETGQWNFQEVRVQGSTIRVELNGTIILDADLARVTHFGFAGHNDPVRFRNIRIKRLGH